MTGVSNGEFVSVSTTVLTTLTAALSIGVMMTGVRSRTSGNLDQMIGDRRIIHAVGRGAAEVKPDIQRRVRVACPEQREHAGIGRASPIGWVAWTVTTGIRLESVVWARALVPKVKMAKGKMNRSPAFEVKMRRFHTQSFQLQIKLTSDDSFVGL